MRAKPIPFADQLELIMECRRSGLTDYQWCQEHDINPGTFYNWVKRHRKNACENIPPANSSNQGRAKTAPVQEVIRINPDQLIPQLSNPSDVSDELPPAHSQQSSHHALEIELNGAILRISNEVSPGLLAQTLRILKGISC